MNAAATPFVESMQEAAAALRLPGSGVAWLDGARAAALQSLVQRGLPDAHDELWKYTTLRALSQRRFAAADGLAATRAVAQAVLPSVGENAARVVFVNGVFDSGLSRLDALPEGLTLQPLSSALRERPEPLRFLLGTQRDDDDGFTLLNRALAAEGVVLRVEAGIRVAKPVHIVHAGLAGERETAWHLRSLVDLGEGASLDLVEYHCGEPGAGHLANLVRDVNLRSQARLAWTSVQAAGADTTLLRRSDCRLGDDAILECHALELGGKLARHEMRVELAGARCRFKSRGAFVLHDRQHADTEVLVAHHGRDTVSDSLWRGVAGGRARGVVHGRILVQPGADGSDGGFYNKNLLLSPDAEIDTRPALEIYADEVKANHGATVGQLDENVLFYLRSRGMPLEAARRILVRAFCAVALDGIQPAPLHEFCEALLAGRLPEAEA